MGDPIKTRKKYSSPRHPWEKSRIDEEAQIIKSYATKNKKEIWKMNSMLKEFKGQAKKLSSLNTKQAEKETKLLFKRLQNMALLKEPSMDAILNLKLEDIMERRLQTILQKKGFARTVKQARQFITHGHVGIDKKIITSPSYLVLEKEESKVTFKSSSGLNDKDHPERFVPKVIKDVKG